jgi:hypothetical protein
MTAWLQWDQRHVAKLAHFHALHYERFKLRSVNFNGHGGGTGLLQPR